MSTWKAKATEKPAPGKPEDRHYPRVMAARVRTAHSERTYKALEAVKEAR